MAAQHTSKLSPEPYQSEQFDLQIDSQASAVIKSNFLPPLKDSQETQDVASDGHDNSGDHGKEVINQSLQPTKGPFISRPERENPVDFQNGFQYSKAPTPQNLPVQPSALPKGIPPKSGSKNDGVVRTGHQIRGTHGPVSDGLFRDAKDIREAGAQLSEPPQNTKEKTYDAVSIHSDPHSESTMSENRNLGAAQDNPASRPPFQITSPFSKISPPFQQSKGNIRSPATQLGEPKLSKAFSDIQRKALIQSTHTRCSSNIPINQVSPSMFHKRELPQDAVGIPKVSSSRARQHQEERDSNYIPNRHPATPEGQAAGAERSRDNQSDATKMTLPYTRDGDEDYNTCTRTESRTSNISKLRVPPVLEHKRSRRQASRIPQDSNAHRRKLAESWNNYFLHEDSQRENWKEKVEDMRNEIAKRDKKVVYYLATIHKRDQMITNLRTVNEEQHSLYEKQESDLAELERQRRSLRGKMKEYKDRLNDSTKEQQNIFNYFQPRYHQMREQMEQAEHIHQRSLEQAHSTTNKIRNQIRKSVEEVRTLSQEEIQKLRIERAILQEKLAEREEEVDREKQYICDLRQELKASHEADKDAIKVLNAQSQELIEKSNEGATQVRNIENCLKQQGLEIQSLLKLFEDNRANTVSHLELAQSLKVLQTELSESVLSGFREHTASDRELSSKTTIALNAEISAIRELCTSLGQQIQDQKNASEWQEKHGKAEMDNQALRWEIDRLQKELLSMKGEVRTQLELYENLQKEIAYLRARARGADEAEKRIMDLERAEQKINESLDEKEKCIRNLEEKLRGAEDALSIQSRELEYRERQVLDEQEKHKQVIAGCLEQQEQAVQRAKAKESEKTRAQYQMIQERLQDAEQNCSRLQQELVQVQHGDENALKNNGAESAKQMLKTIEPTVNRINELLDGLQALEQEKSGLAANLEAWSNDHIELSLLQQVVQKLVKDQKAAVGNGKQLWELLDVQKKLEGTWQSHKSEVDAIKRAIELEKSVNAETESGRGRKGKRPVNRRVTIRFPGDKDTNDGLVVPMSVEEERATRRQAASPTGIMKPTLLQAEGRPEGPYHKIPAAPKEARGRSKRRVSNRGVLVSHSAYNRPVLGTEGLASDSIPDNTETVFADMSSTTKRKRAQSQVDDRENMEKKPRSTEKRPAKISRSMSSYFDDPVPEEPVIGPVQQQLQLGQSRGGPIERRSRSFVTYGSMGSGTQ